MHIFYRQLASWWPQISPVEHYQQEAQFYIELLRARRPHALSLLELGSGGGHNAFFLKQHFPQVTLTDLSAEMLSISQALNPECHHLQGDMRSLDLGRQFDLVFAHDALDYLISEAELLSTFQVAYRHLKPGGLYLLVPDHVRERYQGSTEAGGSGSIRYLQWCREVAPQDTVGIAHYAFLLQQADGTTQCLSEDHPFGLFPQGVWVDCLESCGFQVELIEEPPQEDHLSRLMFAASKPLLPDS